MDFTLYNILFQKFYHNFKRKHFFKLQFVNKEIFKYNIDKRINSNNETNHLKYDNKIKNL